MVTRRNTGPMRHTWREGFSLVEVVVASVGVVALGGVLMTVYLTQSRALEMLMAKSNATSDLRNIMEQIGRDTRAAQAAVVNGTTTCGFTASSTVLILQPTTGSCTNAVVYSCIDNTGTPNITYCQAATPGNLQRTFIPPTGPSQQRTIADVTDLSFTPTSGTNRRCIAVKLGLRRKIRGTLYYYADDTGTSTKSLTDSFRLRNAP